MVFCSTDSHWSVSLKVLEGNIIWPKTLRMLKFHPITAFMKMHANFQNYFWLGFFSLKYLFPIRYKIRILDLTLLLKNSIPFEGLYYNSVSETVVTLRVDEYSNVEGDSYLGQAECIWKLSICRPRFPSQIAVVLIQIRTVQNCLRLTCFRYLPTF